MSRISAELKSIGLICIMGAWAKLEYDKIAPFREQENSLLQETHRNLDYWVTSRDAPFTDCEAWDAIMEKAGENVGTSLDKGITASFSRIDQELKTMFIVVFSTLFFAVTALSIGEKIYETYKVRKTRDQDNKDDSKNATATQVT